jgi:hypothetical protein
MEARLRAICGEFGVFLRREAEELGCSDYAFTSLVKAKVWHRVRHGAYTFGDVWTALDDNARFGLLCRAVLRQAATEVVLSHTGAVNEWGAPLWDLDLNMVHVTRPDGRAGRSESGVCQHRGRLLPGDRMWRNGVEVMSPTRAALEITTLFDVEHSLVVIDDLLHRGLTTPEQLTERYAHMAHWPNTLHTDLILRLADGRPESVGESRTAFLCWSQGLPAPIPQYKIRDRAGNVIARVDFAWPELGLFVEFDGKVKYQRYLREGESVTDVVLREKTREELVCRLTGWRCLRLVWADLYYPARTAARIRSLFRPAAA